MTDMPTAICNHCQNLLSLAEITTENGMERPKLQLLHHEPNHLLLGEKDFSESRCKFFGLFLFHSFTVKDATLSVVLLPV